MKGGEKEKKSLKRIYTFMTSTAVRVVDYRKESFHAVACIYIYIQLLLTTNNYDGVRSKKKSITNQLHHQRHAAINIT